jgi:shikimate dehydrogenase
MQEVRCGLIGAGISMSLSPPLHQAEGRHHDLEVTYTLIDVDTIAAEVSLADLLIKAQNEGYVGLNITHPYKQAILTELDELSPHARAVGAVNTVVFHDGRRIGHNTDAYGFAEAFRRDLPGERRERVVQIGAGGAGAACAHAQLADGVGHLTIIEPDERRRADLAATLAASFGQDRITHAPPDGLADAVATADGIVNASPVGMRAHPGLPLPADLLRAGLWVFDVIYMPLPTALVTAARERGLRATGGAGMCVFQAAGAFELFTGRQPDTERMLAHLRQLLDLPTSSQNS